MDNGSEDIEPQQSGNQNDDVDMDDPKHQIDKKKLFRFVACDILYTRIYSFIQFFNAILYLALLLGIFGGNIAGYFWLGHWWYPVGVIYTITIIFLGKKLSDYLYSFPDPSRQHTHYSHCTPSDHQDDDE